MTAASTSQLSNASSTKKTSPPKPTTNLWPPTAEKLSADETREQQLARITGMGISLPGAGRAQHKDIVAYVPPPKKDKKKTVREADVEQPLLTNGNSPAASTDASGGSSPTRQRRITIEDAETLKIITPGGDPSAAASAASAALSARLLADAATNNRGRLDCSSILLLALVSTVCGAAGGVLAQGDAAANLRQLIADGGTTLLIVVGAVGLCGWCVAFSLWWSSSAVEPARFAPALPSPPRSPPRSFRAAASCV